MICERYDVVVVPFPFIDRARTKKRPALVLSCRAFNRNNHTILAMITTKHHPPWPGDAPITNYVAAGLHLPRIARFKLFTLDNRFLLRKIGHLSEIDTSEIQKQVRASLLPT